jgi:hypothetical protein
MNSYSMENSIPRKIGRFAKGLWSDDDLWVRFSAFTGGFSLIAEMTAASYFLITATPLAVTIPAVGGCAVLATAGLYGIYAGITGTGSRLKSMYREIFKGHAPKTEPKAHKPFLKFTEQIPGLQKISRKLSAAKEARSKSQSPQKKDLLMSLLTLKSSIFGLTVAGLVIVPHVMAAGAASLLSARVILPALYGTYEAIKGYRGTRVFIRSVFNKKYYLQGKKTSPAISPPARPASSSASMPDTPLSASFSKEAAPGAEKKTAAQAPARHAAAQPNPAQ